MRTLLFVCPHGAGKSRMAAAFFARVAPPGWEATSAGLDPGPELSPTAARLLAETDAAPHLDTAPPRSVASVPSTSRIVGIDCSPPGMTERWDLGNQAFDTAMREEIRAQAETLAANLGES